jgi:type IV pilus assembly protein PilQ
MHLFISINRLRLGLLALVIGGVLVFNGCASTRIKEDVDAALTEPEQSAEAVSENESISVESINIVGDGDKVLISTTGVVRYTVFKLSDPSRLIVDLPDVDLDKLGPRIDVDNYFMKDITVESYGGEENIGRIVIELKEGIDYDVKSGENSILVSLIEGYSFAPAPAVEEEESFDSNALLDAEVIIEEIEAPAEELPDAEMVDASPVYEAEEANGVDVEEGLAKSLLALELSEETGATVVNIVADGVIGNYTSFEIDNPSRIVMDLWGLANVSGWDRLNTGGSFIKAVRVGMHPDKTRLVFDSAGEGIPPYVVAKAGNTIKITFGGAPDGVVDEGLVEAAEADMPDMMDIELVEAEELSGPVVEAVEEAVVEAVEEAVEEAVVEEAVEEMVLEPPLEIADVELALEEEEEEEAFVEMAAQEEFEPEPVYEEPIGAEIESISFKRVGPKGRLTIKGSAAMEYMVNESMDKMTVLLDIDGVTIRKELIRTLDATKLDTPVASISSYQESFDRREVRVLVKLKEKAIYDVKEVNGTITIDFKFPPPEVATKVEIKEEKSLLKMEEGNYIGKKINLDMVDANITDVLRLLAEVSDLNIIAADDVKGTISLRLKNVPWDQAFDIILKAKGLGKTIEGNVVRVASKGKIRQENEAKLAAMKAREKLESLSLEFVAINYADAGKLITQVKDVLSGRGSVTSESRTNTLIIKDTKKGIEAAVNLIARLDTEIPQVLIEARIVEASTSFARDLGIQWGADYQRGSLDTFGSSTVSGQTPPSNATPPVFATRHGAGEYAVNLPASGTAGTLGALGFVLGKAGNPLILDLRLSAGESQGQLRTISRPRIVTMDNKEAKIEQGESIPFETTSASGTSTQFIDANLSLTVTPHITPDGSVLMKIKASRNSIGTFRSSSGEPSINKKETSTEVLVRDGETTVIGGIVVSDTSNTGKGIPYLKDIPVLGWLFKSKSMVDTQTELLIFITPTILKSKVSSKISG